MAVRKKTSLAHKAVSIFIPIRHNKYRPWIARIPGVFAIIITLLVLHLLLNGFSITSQKPSKTNLAQANQELLSEINDKRRDSGSGQLKLDSRLASAAQNKAEHMIKNDYWAHNSPEGIGAWSFIHSEKYYYSKSAENLARGFRTTVGVVGGWQASKPHREAMLNKSYSQAGFGIARGKLGDEQTTVYVGLFAEPLSGAAVNSPELSRKILSLKGQSERHFSNQDVVNFSLLNPISPNSTLTIPGKIALVVLVGLMIIYLSQHILIRKKRIVWQPKVHEHPIFRLVVIVVIISIIIATSFGSIA